MKICIIAHRAYGALTGEEHGHIGGVERQTALLANWLVKRGHEVSVITWHEHGADLEYVDDIKIIKLCAESIAILPCAQQLGRMRIEQAKRRN